MELVTLQFPTAKMLWGFRLEIESRTFEVNPRERTLTCRCSEEDIKLAIEKYAAKVVPGISQKIVT